MKSKNKALMFLCLLVALFSIRPSFASTDDQNQPTSPQTDIKSGDEITITEEEPIENQHELPPVKAEVIKPQKAAGRRPVQKENVTTKNNTSPSLTVDPRATEVNERVNKKYREEQKAKESQKTETKKEIKPANKAKTVNKKPSPTKADVERKSEIDALLKELNERTEAIKSNLKPSSSDTKKPSKGAENYKNAVELVGEVMLSDKITKAKSKQLAKTTKEIVEQYNKKIENAATTEEKEALVREASQKINENLKNTSKEAYDTAINKDVSIYDQKNETLVLEIEPNDKEDSKEGNKNYKVTKSTSLEKPPKLANDDNEAPFFKMALGVFVVLIISLAIAITVVLKNRNNVTK
ncbi:hypothetical protein [uncultured Anaerococcus sp.]|uniref:hypothetical protein n=1 Tax=uncultured Anaerococcus sp. TaxID=293428 RepID=UPI0025D15547|nr:hypothetical protein [uncultured Anaerococcus sp.]